MKHIRTYGFSIALILLLGFLLQMKMGSHSPSEAQASYIPTRYILEGTASWYSKKSPGIRKRTANNEIFDDQDLTCAMWGVAFNQRIKVTNKANGLSVVVRVNDRGPHKRYVQEGRIIDLTKTAFSKISPTNKGLIDIELEFL